MGDWGWSFKCEIYVKRQPNNKQIMILYVTKSISIFQIVGKEKRNGKKGFDPQNWHETCL